MIAFRDIDALLRMIAREKEILKFLFTGRKAPSLRSEQALEGFLDRDQRRLGLLLEHGVVRLEEGVLVLEDTYLRFFEDVLEVNEEINVASVRQHIDALLENIDLWFTAGTQVQKGRFMAEVVRILRNIGLSTQRNVIDLKRNIDSTYKNERDYALKRKRLEQLDVKREDIALLVKEAEKVIDAHPPGFFGDVAGEVKRQLTEAYHNLLELDRQIIRYLNRIEAERALVEKVRRVKYLKDQLVWERQTDVLFVLQTHRYAFLEKRPKYGCLPSLEAVTGSADGLAALKEAHAALRHPVLKVKTVGEPLSATDLSRPPAVADVLSTYEVLSAFIGSSADLMTFLSGYGFSRPVTEEERLTLFCRIASEFPEDLRIGPEVAESVTYSYPLIYAK